MNPAVLDKLVKLHIEELHRDAAASRIGRKPTKGTPARRRPLRARLQRAPAH